MKENKVRSFEDYQMELKGRGIQHDAVITGSQQHKQSKATIRKTSSKQHLSKQHLKPTPNNNINNNTPQPQNPKLSPNRHKNHNHSPIKSLVSYGQLQVILKNIDSIKLKAKEQMLILQQKIGQLEGRNQALLSEIEEMKVEVGRARKAEEKGRREMEQIRKSLASSSGEFDKRVEKIQVQRRVWIQQKQQYLQQILNYQQTQRISQQQIQQLQHNLQQQTTLQIQHFTKYSSLVNTITANNPQRLPQLLYQLSNKYNSQSVLDVVGELEKRVVKGQRESERLEMEKERVAEKMDGVLEEKARLQGMVEKVMEENRLLVQGISGKEMEANKRLEKVKGQYEGRINDIEESHIREIGDIKDKHKGEIEQLQAMIQDIKHHLCQTTSQLDSLRQQHNLKLEHITQLQHTIQTLSNQLQALTCKHNQLQHQHQQHLMQQKYFQVVDQQCCQLSDLSKVLTKLQTLEKCKIENRTNIQKVQFLCRMLDC